MSLLRLCARLDIKGPNVVKGVQMEGLRVVGKPADLATRYANEGAHELIYIDTVASLYGRNQLSSLLEETTSDVFVPITVGGGIRSLADVRSLLAAGADKVAINTAAIKRPGLINEIASVTGSQCVVVSVEAKQSGNGWECLTDCGREKSGKDAIAWAREAVERGAGEILITSVDKDGTRGGMDLPLISALRHLPVPVTACGGVGTIQDLQAGIDAGADAVAMGAALHYGQISFSELKRIYET